MQLRLKKGSIELDFLLMPELFPINMNVTRYFNYLLQPKYPKSQ
jgi:hypothetical protein